MTTKRKGHSRQWHDFGAFWPTDLPATPCCKRREGTRVSRLKTVKKHTCCLTIRVRTNTTQSGQTSHTVHMNKGLYSMFKSNNEDVSMHAQ